MVESKCMNNEVTLEELDNNLRQTTKMASDNEQKLDELSRKDVHSFQYYFQLIMGYNWENIFVFAIEAFDMCI